MIDKLIEIVQNLPNIQQTAITEEDDVDEYVDESESVVGDDADPEEKSDVTESKTEDSTKELFNVKFVDVGGGFCKLECTLEKGSDSSIENEKRKKIVERVAKREWEASPLAMINLKSDMMKGTTQVAEDVLKKNVKKCITTKNWKELRKLVEGVDRTKYPMGEIVFGKRGEQVEVMKPVKTRVLLMLSGRETTSFKFLPLSDPKYTLEITPSEGTLSHHGRRAVIVIIKLCMKCTASVTMNLPVILCHGSKRYEKKLLQDEKAVGNPKLFNCVLTSKLQGMISTFLDLDELVVQKQELGKGKFGTVYSGKYRGADVACRILDPDQYTTETANRDLQREVKMFESLRHPCIVNFVGCTLIPGVKVITTELCEYGSLIDSIKKKPDMWTMAMKVKALYDCSRAMDFLHRSSVIHRDLKPENLLVVSLELNSPVVCKLSDFGTTKAVHAIVQAYQTKGVGTEYYKAPEIIAGGTKYTNKVDVFSFGIMIASVVDGCDYPYHNVPDMGSADFVSKIEGGTRPIVTNQNEMPEELRKIMEKSWNANPVERPSFEDISSRLGKLLEKKSSSDSSPKSPSHHPHGPRLRHSGTWTPTPTPPQTPPASRFPTPGSIRRTSTSFPRPLTSSDISDKRP